MGRRKIGNPSVTKIASRGFPGRGREGKREGRQQSILQRSRWVREDKPRVARTRHTSATGIGLFSVRRQYLHQPIGRLVTSFVTCHTSSALLPTSRRAYVTFLLLLMTHFPASQPRPAAIFSYGSAWVLFGGTPLHSTISTRQDRSSQRPTTGTPVIPCTPPMSGHSDPHGLVRLNGDTNPTHDRLNQDLVVPIRQYPVRARFGHDVHMINLVMPLEE